MPHKLATPPSILTRPKVPHQFVFADQSVTRSLVEPTQLTPRQRDDAETLQIKFDLQRVRLEQQRANERAREAQQGRTLFADATSFLTDRRRVRLFQIMTSLLTVHRL